jgi:CRP-like cAMP-binding protein
LLSDRTRNATIRACTAMDVLIIPKAEFNKLRRCVPAFGNFFSDLASARALTASPHSSTDRLGTYISKMAGEMRQVNGQDSAGPTPDEVMHEPIIRLMMESDHVTEDVLRHVMTIARRRLGHVTHQRKEYRTVVRDDLLLD